MLLVVGRRPCGLARARLRGCLSISFYNWSIVALQCCVTLLLYNEVNQLYVYIHPLPLGPPSQSSQTDKSHSKLVDVFSSNVVDISLICLLPFPQLLVTDPIFLWRNCLSLFHMAFLGLQSRILCSSGHGDGGLVTKSCSTLATPWTVGPPGSSVHGIFQARILEWIAISFSRGSSQPRNQTQVSCIAGRFWP